MKWPQKVLVYLDAMSDIPQVALDHGVLLAKNAEASLSIVDIDEPPNTPLWSDPEEIAETHQAIRWQKEAYLDDAVENSRAENVPVSSELLEGKTFIELIRAVLKGKNDLLVKTMMRESEGIQRLFGTTATHLLRKCPCPVLLVKPGQTAFRKVVVALGPLESEETAQFNRNILEKAQAIAQAHGASLSIIHAWEFYGESMLSKRLSVDEIDARIAEEHARIEEKLGTFVREVLSDSPPDMLVIENGPAHALIPAYIKETDADLLVLGTVARSGLRGLLIGNTAETVMEQIDCSILALKPDGFVSPITL